MENPTATNKRANIQGNGHAENRITEILMPEKPEVTKLSLLESELELLRNDCIMRISGMLKAIAAVKRNHDKAFEVIGYVEKLTEMKSAELIEEYRRVSAGFRNAFPSSFGLLRMESGRGSRLKNPEVYK